jgi:hypothetical protein
VTAALLLLLPCVTPEPVEAPHFASRPLPGWSVGWTCDDTEILTPKGWQPRWYDEAVPGCPVRFLLNLKTFEYEESPGWYITVDFPDGWSWDGEVYKTRREAINAARDYSRFYGYRMAFVLTHSDGCRTPENDKQPWLENPTGTL